MAKVTLKGLSHSYLKTQSSDADWAIRGVDIDWNDGGAYALLGPSGCGKTTLLNIISGLITPTKGDILFDDKVIYLKILAVLPGIFFTIRSFVACISCFLSIFKMNEFPLFFCDQQTVARKVSDAPRDFEIGDYQF